MGNRVMVTVTNGEDYSPTLYLHWGGSDIVEMLKQLKIVMESRGPDVSYTIARLVAIACEKFPGNMSVGLCNASSDHWAMDSPGDAGAVLYNCKTQKVYCADSYLSKEYFKDSGFEYVEVPVNKMRFHDGTITGICS